jgi:hypothetical protein
LVRGHLETELQNSQGGKCQNMQRDYLIMCSVKSSGVISAGNLNVSQLLS